MSDFEPGEARTVENAVDELGEGLAAALDEHPAPRRLIAYQRGELSAAARETLRDHLALCRDCADLLLELEAWPRTASSAEQGADQRERVWGSLISELAATETETSSRASAARSQRQWLALAALLLISFALGGLAAMGWRASGAVERLAVAEARIHQLEERQLSGPQLVVPSLDLFPPGFQRYDAGLPILEIPRSARVVTLQLHRIESGSATDFELVIRDASGAEVWRGKDLEPTAAGSFVIALPRDFLPPGTYQLEIHGLSETSEQLLDTYELRLVHEGSSETAGFD